MAEENGQLVVEQEAEAGAQVYNKGLPPPQLGVEAAEMSGWRGLLSKVACLQPVVGDTKRRG